MSPRKYPLPTLHFPVPYVYCDNDKLKALCMTANHDKLHLWQYFTRFTQVIYSLHLILSGIDELGFKEQPFILDD